eukprot:3032080-Amphidinium_carterae.1
MLAAMNPYHIATHCSVKSCKVTPLGKHWLEFLDTSVSSVSAHVPRSELPPELLITFGSGSIYAVVAEDVVK